ncbi:MAG: SDR family oxidoreductase, partial [Gammaproteobacteria bacterium]|nr:SDR family oxidoreductase [Gammaproteobacteria bacterium]
MTIFRDNVAIVTGASMGLGRELALQLAGQGAWLALAARSGDRLAETARECEDRGGRAIAVRTDVTQPEQCGILVDKTVKSYGRVNTLINNAGAGMTARFDEVRDLAHYERIMATNYLGSVYPTHHALPYLKQTGGRIAVMSSLAGKTGVPLYTAYCASKHALVGFYESLRIEL